jgi:hypothetical protein
MTNAGSAISGTDAPSGAVTMLLCCACTGATGAGAGVSGVLGAVEGVPMLMRGEEGDSSSAAAERVLFCLQDSSSSSVK